MAEGKKSYSLKVEQVPSYPFINSFFDVTVDLIDDATGLLKCGLEVAMTVKLLVGENDKSSFLDVETINPSISKSGFAKLKVKILEPSMRFDNQDFVLEVSPKELGVNNISSARSEGMFAVSHQLIIDGGHVPKSWFKDRGGKDSFIELGVSLVDSSKKLVTNRRVPLKVFLLYESEELVANQNILSHSADTKLQIDSTGRTYIRFRIGEVSRNHQKQSFCLKIGPDTIPHPLNNDISPVITDCVEVLSKPRSGKERKEEAVLNGKRKNDDSVEILTCTSRKEPKISIKGIESSGISALLEAHTMSSIPSGPYEESQIADLIRMAKSETSRKQGAKGAFSDLMKWMKMVMDEIIQLKWRQVGLEKMPDGSTEPLVVRKNPNLAIDDLVRRYNEYAVPNMRMLFKDIFYVNDSDIPDTHINSLYFDKDIGAAFDELPPNGPPKFGQQHSLMSNPEDWPDVVFTPSEDTRQEDLA